MNDALPSDPLIHALSCLDSCSVANAIEEFNVRLRNQGFSDSSIACRFPSLPPMAGYAVTVQIRTASPPIKGSRYFEQADWWDSFEAVPMPRILVIEDVDRSPGVGSLVGEVHAHIFNTLGVQGIVTNGAVRGLPVMEAMGIRLFSGSVSVSHAYAHIVAIGKPVRVGSLEVNPGDLLHGDRHGIVNVPRAVAAQLPGIAARQQNADRKVIELCASSDFSISELKRAIQEGNCLPGLDSAPE
jgi:4-hydroxy-4-methyl-2-oxoglutarate aldolase